MSTMSPLCFSNPKTFRAQRCHVHHVTFVQSLFVKSWTKLDMSPKCVCPLSTKTTENNWKFLCTTKVWLILVTWHQKVQMAKNWTCHLCALNSRYGIYSLILTFYAAVVYSLAHMWWQKLCWYPTPQKSYTRNSRGARGVGSIHPPLSLLTILYIFWCSRQRNYCRSLDGMHGYIYCIPANFIIKAL